MCDGCMEREEDVRAKELLRNNPFIRDSFECYISRELEEHQEYFENIIQPDPLDEAYHEQINTPKCDIPKSE